MEESTIIETLETSLLANVWVERRFIIFLMVATTIGIYVQLNLSEFLELLLYFFLFIGIVFLGFVAIAAHIRYYCHFERHRKVELYADKMVVSVKDRVREQILKNDIVKITLYDKRHIDEGNLFPTLLDSFYYLVVVGKNQERFVLTCLLDIRLKKKMANWYGQNIEHQYQFFPFPD